MKQGLRKRILQLLTEDYPRGLQLISITENLFDYPINEVERAVYQMHSKGHLERKYHGFYKFKKISKRRRYYLHHVLKRHYKLDVKQRIVFIEEYIESTKDKLKELEVNGYTLQTVMQVTKDHKCFLKNQYKIQSSNTMRNKQEMITN